MKTLNDFFTPADPEILDMEYLFTTATNPDKPLLQNENKNSPQIYHELVFYRFIETINGIFPRFSEISGDEKTTILAKNFMKSGARTPYIWKMSGEFADFIESSSQVDTISKDTVWYEWNEYYLYRKDHDRNSSNHVALNMNLSYSISPDARIRSLSRAVHRIDPKNPEEPVETTLVLFYSEETSEVYYTEVSGFIYQCLETLESDLLENVITHTCNAYELPQEDSIEALKIAGEFFDHLLKKGIIVVRKNNHDNQRL